MIGSSYRTVSLESQQKREGRRETNEVLQTC